VRADKPGSIRSATIGVCVDSPSLPRCTAEDGKPPAPPQPTVTPDPEPLPAEPCPTNGHDGRCGTPDRTPPQVRIISLVEQQVFLRRSSPYVFSGRVGVPYGDRNVLEPDAVDLHAVKLRLTRTHGGKCWTFSRTKRALRRITRCGVEHGYWFSIPNPSPSWSYRLPGRLRGCPVVRRTKAAVLPPRPVPLGPWRVRSQSTEDRRNRRDEDRSDR
jgi:hypothetical protein